MGERFAAGAAWAPTGHRFLLGRDPADGIASHGRAFNFALLLSYGGTLVHVDDDVLCRACPPPLAVSRAIRWDPLLRDAAFFRSDHEREAHCAGTEANPVAPMSGSVGRGVAAVGAALQRAEGLAARYEGMKADDAEALSSGRPRVAVSTCGLYGDPGTASASWMFELEGDSTRRFMIDPDRYKNALRDRNLWLGSDGYRFTRGHGLLSPLRALDHRTPLPPFFPLFRGSDYLFGRLLPLADRDAWFLEFPWAVPHLPEPRRRRPADLLDRPGALSFARFTSLFWGQRLLPPLSGNVRHRLELLGGRIRGMGEADPALIREAISNSLRYLQSNLIRHLERQLHAGPDIPPWYQRDLTHLIDVNRRAIEEPGAPRISDMSRQDREGDPASWTLELWRKYGSAMQAWPDILAAAGSLLEKPSG